MRKLVLLVFLPLLAAASASAADLQGVLADWNCTRDMVSQGREKVLRHNRNCSLVKNYNRAAYAVITQDKKYFRLDDNGNKLARELLANSPNKDNLKVIVSGDIDGDTIKVTNMSEL
ncbi:MAG TPA: hypothetical protein VHU83_16300 [Bryobacteraceae bacterium]|jgi:hypothetical protein|nr:hypothetical protein [Bryobacteraceae bacterium]